MRNVPHKCSSPKLESSTAGLRAIVTWCECLIIMIASSSPYDAEAEQLCANMQKRRAQHVATNLMSEQLYHDMAVRMADVRSSDFVKLSSSKHVALQFLKSVELGCSVSMTPHHKNALLYMDSVGSCGCGWVTAREPSLTDNGSILIYSLQHSVATSSQATTPTSSATCNLRFQCPHLEFPFVRRRRALSMLTVAALARYLRMSETQNTAFFQK